MNHEAPSAFAADTVRGALGAGAVTLDAVSMASDDMSLFLQARPGCYLFVGAAPEDGPAPPHHAPEFRMNEDALTLGLRAGLAVMLAALGPRR